MRLLWLKVYAPVVEANSSAHSTAWDGHDAASADGLLAEDGDTIVDGVVPVRQRGWSVSAAPRRVAPWAAAAARRSAADSVR